MVLNPQQFPKPGDERVINGEPHTFGGWHMTDEPNFEHDPEYEHFDNVEMADPGDVYYSHDAPYWGKFMGNRSHAVEVWEKKRPAKTAEQYAQEMPNKSPRTHKFYAEMDKVQGMNPMVPDPFEHSVTETYGTPGRDITLGRTHEFTEALKKHTSAFVSGSKFDMHLALGPGPRYKEIPGNDEEPPTYKIVQARAYGGL